MSQTVGTLGKQIATEFTDKNFPWKEHMDVSRCGTNKVAQSTFSSHGSSRACQDPPTLGVSRKLTSSTSSIDSECSQRGSSNRTHYTTLADIPRVKRLRPDLATLSKKGRKCSPGKAEVEKMFGEERRTAEALEAFQALEVGLIKSLSGKYSLMEQRRARRQSTPCLYPEESVHMRQELRMRRASLHPPPRTDMGRAAVKEPEWINRNKILRPVGPQDKKEEKLNKNTELAWKNRENFLKPREEKLDKNTELSWKNRENVLKSTPAPREASHEHQASTHVEHRSRENHQASISRTSSEPTISSFGSSQYQKHERSQKMEQQRKPSPTNYPESYYTGSNHLHHTQHRPSYGSLLETEQLYIQANAIQETKNIGWSQYKPAGPLTCHTPEPQKQQFLGFSEIESVPLKIELKAAETQTDQETSKNGAAPFIASPKESSNITSVGQPSLSDTKLKSVEEPSFFPPESEIKAYTPPENMKKELHRTETSSISTKVYTHSVELHHGNLKELQKYSAPEITYNDFISTSFKTSPRTEASVSDKPESQHSDTGKSLCKGATELDNRECAYEDRPQQQSYPPPSSSSPEPANSDQEPKYSAGRSMYKPAGPLSCYRTEPQNQILVEWYSGTESPLSKVVLRPTRTIRETSENVTSEPAQENDSNNSQDVDTVKEFRSQNIWDENDHLRAARSRPCTPSEHLKMEPEELQRNAYQIGYGNPSSPEHISNDLKELHLSNASKMFYNEEMAPRSKASYVSDDPPVPDESLTKGIPPFQHCEYSAADTAEYEEACDTDMYLNTMAKHIKHCPLYKSPSMYRLESRCEDRSHFLKTAP